MAGWRGVRVAPLYLTSVNHTGRVGEEQEDSRSWASLKLLRPRKDKLEGQVIIIAFGFGTTQKTTKAFVVLFAGPGRHWILLA